LRSIACDDLYRERNRSATFYALTRKGRRTAQAELDGWRRLSGASARVLEQEA
jgi:hypothetical protein